MENKNNFTKYSLKTRSIKMITTCFNGYTINYFRIFRLCLNFYYYKWHHDRYPFANTVFRAINYLPSAQH